MEHCKSCGKPLGDVHTCSPQVAWAIKGPDGILGWTADISDVIAWRNFLAAPIGSEPYHEAVRDGYRAVRVTITEAGE